MFYLKSRFIGTKIYEGDAFMDKFKVLFHDGNIIELNLTFEVCVHMKSTDPVKLVNLIIECTSVDIEDCHFSMVRV